MIHANDNCDNNFKAIQAGVGGNPKHLIVQWVENHEELEKYVGKSLGQIGMEDGKHPIAAMLDIAVATDLKAEFLGPNRGFNPEYMGGDHQQLAVHLPRSFGRWRAYEVLHRRGFHDGLPALAGAR